MSEKNKIVITSIDDEEMKFTLMNSNVEFANAIRRTMISDVATLAIDIVTVQENSSCLPDEAIVHRLGLLPVDSRRAKEMNNRQECPCNDVCPRCAALFELNVSCDMNHGGTLEVTHDDVKPILQQGADNPVQLTTPYEGLKIPIVKLRQGQSIKMKMTAYKGTGRIHAKWSPTAIVSFKYEPHITLYKSIQELSATEKRSFVDVCHQNVFALDSTSRTDAVMFMSQPDEGDVKEEDGDLIAKNQSVCDFCGDCGNLAIDKGMRGAVQVDFKEGIFHFVVESTGVLSSKDIVVNALAEMVIKFNVLLRECSDLPGMIRQAQTHAKTTFNMPNQPYGGHDQAGFGGSTAGYGDQIDLS